MSQLGIILSTASGFFVSDLTGNTGGPVPANAGNINIVGTGGVTVTGNPGTNTLTISAPGEASLFTEDSGTATPALGNLNVIGGTSVGGVATNINTIGSGSTVQIALNNNINLPNTKAGGTAGVYLYNSIPYLHNYAGLNVFLGPDAGNFTLTATNIVAVGNSAGIALTSGSSNTLLGSICAISLTTGANNVVCGTGALATETTGSNNTALGDLSLLSQIGGSYNSAVGRSAGSNYTSIESSNICLNSPGVLSESNTLHIGAGTGAGVQQLNAAYISGIYNKTVGATSGFVVVDSTDKLGMAAGGSSAVLGVGNGGTGRSTLTNHSVLVGAGTSAITQLSVGATNTVLLGNTGADPSFGTVPNAALTNSSITLSNGNNITVTGSPVSLGGTASFNLTGTTTNAVQIGNAGGSLTSLGIGTNGQILLGATAGPPTWVTPTVNTGLTLTTNATTLVYGLTIPVVVSSGGTGAITLTSHGVLLGNTTSAVTATAAGTTGQVLTGVTGSAPTFQSPAASSITITGDTGGALAGAAFTFAGGTTGLSFGGAGSTETLTFAGITANGGVVNLGTDSANNAINIGTVSAAGRVITLGNTTGTTGISEYVGTGNFLLDGVGASTYRIGASTTTGTIIIGGTAGTGLMTFGSSSGTQIVNIGTGSGANAVNIGTSGTGIVTIGNTTGNSAITGTLTTSGAITITSGNLTLTSGNLAITAATTSTVGQITQAGTRVFHTYGTSNLFVGATSGNFTTTGAGGNVGLGIATLISLTSGANNLAIGAYSLTLATTASYNTAVGYGSLQGLTTSGDQNTAIGRQSGYQLQTGGHNVLIGHIAGSAYTTSESSNIIIGANVTGTVGESNTVRIGTQGSGTDQQNKCFIAGISGVTVTGTAVLCSTIGLLGTVVSSERYKENIEDINDISERIYDLRPVTFNYKPSYAKPTPEGDPSKETQYGLIAEEVEAVIPELVLHDKDGIADAVQYHKLDALLLNEIQKLRKELTALKEKLNVL